LYNIWQELATFKSLVCYYTGGRALLPKVWTRGIRGGLPLMLKLLMNLPDAGDNCVLVLLDRRES